jgi:Arc/MetJ-type ribon-helix-helix transcriptional regulator
LNSSSTRRIALRLTPQEDDEINDYLSTSLRFKTKSELIRAAVYSYIHQPAPKARNEDQEAQLSKATANLLDQMVVKGLFRNRNDAIEFIVRKATEEHFLPLWLNKLIRGYLDTRNLLEQDDFSLPEESEERQRGEKD